MAQVIEDALSKVIGQTRPNIAASAPVAALAEASQQVYLQLLDKLCGSKPL